MNLPIGAGPHKLVTQEPGTKLEFEAFEGYYRPVHVKKFTIISVPDNTTRVATIERVKQTSFTGFRESWSSGSRATRS